jgi:hypothetical protein
VRMPRAWSGAAEDGRPLAVGARLEDLAWGLVHVVNHGVLESERDGAIGRGALQQRDAEPPGELRAVLDDRGEGAQGAHVLLAEEAREESLHPGAPVVVGDQMDLVRHHRPGPEGASLEDRGEALVGRDDRLGLVGAQRVAVVAGGDADPGLGVPQEVDEVVVDLLCQGPVRDEVGVGALVSPLDGAPDGFAADVGLPRRGGGDDEGALAVEASQALGAIVQGEVEGGGRGLMALTRGLLGHGYLRVSQGGATRHV